MFELVEDWDLILKKAWSVKFSILAAIFGGLEVAIQMLEPDFAPRGVMAFIAALISIGAVGARVKAQKEISGGKTPE